MTYVCVFVLLICSTVSQIVDNKVRWRLVSTPFYSILFFSILSHTHLVFSSSSFTFHLVLCCSVSPPGCFLAKPSIDPPPPPVVSWLIHYAHRHSHSPHDWRCPVPELMCFICQTHEQRQTDTTGETWHWPWHHRGTPPAASLQLFIAMTCDSLVY